MSDLAPAQLPGAADRRAALAGYGILDTPPEAEFDDIVQLAGEICGTEIALITLLDGRRQWFKAQVGADRSETPIEQALCVHTLNEGATLVIPDLTADPRTRGNPLVTGAPFLRFYAGAPLRTPGGTILGTLCVMDRAARREGLDPRRRTSLERLARLVMGQLELRRAVSDSRAITLQSRDAETRHRQILDSAIDYGIITLDLRGNITSWNTGAERILGWCAAEIVGRPADVFFTPEDVTAGIPEAEMRSARDHGRARDERWHIRKGGERFYALGEMMQLTSAEGAQVGYLKILRDRTRQREIDRQLREAAERLEIALDASGVVGLWDWMVDTDLLHGDANFARLYGLDPDRTAQGLTMEQYQHFVVPADLPDLRWRIRATFETGCPFEVEYRLALPGRDLRWIECKGRMVHDAEGRAERFSGSAVDVTDRKEAEAETRRLAAIVEQSGDFIGVAGLDGRVSWLNEAGRALVGLPDEAAARATTIRDYFDPADWDAIAATAFPAMEASGQWRGEVNFRHFGTGEPIPVMWDVIALRDDRGAATAYATVTRDIRVRRRAEAQQQVLNEELSHRMKNTLAMVQAIASQTLRSTTDPSALTAFRQRLQAISSAHDVLLKRQWTAAEMEEVVRSVLGNFGMDERFDISGPSVPLGSRATLSLSLLLHELATNALKHGALASEMGRVAVDWRLEDTGTAAELRLSWTETGGPPPRLPDERRQGFGSRLIGMGLVGTGGSDLRYRDDGLRAEFTAPLEQMQLS
ncbi:PAS domain S-box protein [Wenxinia saemankumensis]|uniref:histidine kinase n=1 Tax=Wenxinia saemankumensis TaxID=1447782 RepID=A0A1M6AF91_9RHOB|nr:PAS domain S-box protein [Wenxinia saemankumensis]SHI35206.1 PAS domain S-box-containing protein [Wenxinia saemankumensis]